MRSIELSDQHVIPQLGYGVWQVDDEQASDVVGKALRAGFRHIDTAQGYGNEAGVGRALRAAADHGIDRDEIFVTTKLWNTNHGYDNTMRAFDESMDKLGLDVLDLFLIHWPIPAQRLYIDTFRAFIELRNQGRVRSIGVSNFPVGYLQHLISETGVTPAVNQIELHPRFNQAALRAFHAEHGIRTQSWSPLGSNFALWDHDLADVPALEHPVVSEIARTHDASPAQVLLAWNMSLGNIVISKSVTESRIIENFASAELELSDGEIEQITALDNGDRVGSDPAESNFGLGE